MKKIDFTGLRHFNLGRALRRLGQSFTEGWYVKGDAASGDRMRLLACNYTSNVIANLVGGTFWTGFLLLLNADDAFVGTISIICTAANLLQFLMPLILERFPRRRTMLTLFRGASYFLNVALMGIIPLFPVGRQLKLLTVAVTVFLVNLINAFISPGLSIWHIQSVPNNVRRQFYSIITMTVGAVVAVVNLAGSKLMDAMTAAGMEYQGVLIIRGITVVLCAVEIYLYFHIREYPYETPKEKFGLKELFCEPFRHPLYLRTVAVAFLWCFAANVPSSYYTVYLLRNLNVSYSYITVISMLNVPVVLLLTPIWRKVLVKFGWFKTLYVAMSVYLVHYLLLSMVTRGTMFLYPTANMLAYVFAIGINLAFTGIPYVNMPEKRQTVFIGFYSSVTNCAALLGVTVGKYFVLSTEKMNLHFLGITFTNKQALMWLTAGLLVLATAGIWWIDRKTPRSD